MAQNLIRLYIPASLTAKSLAPLSEAQSHYLMHVMRKKVNDSLLVFNAQEGEWHALIHSFHKKICTLEIVSQRRPFSNEPPIALYFSAIKKSRLPILIEKATELGVTHLYPLLTQNTSHPYISLERLQTTAIEASEQSDRLSIPQIFPLQKLETLLENWSNPHEILFVGDERRHTQTLYEALKNNKMEKINFLVGPEGGFSEQEFSLFSQLSFIKPTTLSPTILRAETAAITALAQIQGLLLSYPR
jgi:16S rRNA (uracil1498-N3)-methyltransferase